MNKNLAPIIAALAVLFIGIAGTSALKANEVKTGTPKKALVVKRIRDLQYPFEAYDKSVAPNATVVVRVLLTGSGTVREASLISGDSVFGQSALENVKDWTFEPNGVERGIMVYGFHMADGRCMKRSSFSQIQITRDYHCLCPLEKFFAASR